MHIATYPLTHPSTNSTTHSYTNSPNHPPTRQHPGTCDLLLFYLLMQAVGWATSSYDHPHGLVCIDCNSWQWDIGTHTTGLTQPPTNTNHTTHHRVSSNHRHTLPTGALPNTTHHTNPHPQTTHTPHTHTQLRYRNSHNRSHTTPTDTNHTTHHRASKENRHTRCLPTWVAVPGAHP
jgi:hypothetical protein